MDQYVTEIVLASVGLITAGVLTLGTALYQKLKPVYEARLDNEQRDLIERIAMDAYAWVERNFPGQGARKFHEAVAYLSSKLEFIGIRINPEELEAAVQRAWEVFNPGKVKS